MDDLLQPISRRRIAGQLALQSEEQSQEEVERRLTDIALTTFNAERINLLTTVEWAFAEQAWEVVETLVGNLNTYLSLRAFWADMVAVGQMAVEAAKQESNRRAEGIALTNLGTVYQFQGRWAEAMAVYEQSLAIERELGDRHSEGGTLTNLGTVYQFQGRWAEAIGAYEQSLAIKRELGDHHGEGGTLTNLGAVYRVQGRWAKAMAAHEQSLAICRELGDRHSEGQTLANLGIVYQFQGELDKALGVCQQSLVIALELDDHLGAIPVLCQLGWILHGQGNLDTAFEHFARAFALALSLHSKSVLDTIDQIIGLAKDVTAAGQMAQVAHFGQKLVEVVEQRQAQEWTDETLQGVAEVCQQVFALIASMGYLANVPSTEQQVVKNQVLQRAQEIDAATQGKWALEAWIRAVLAKQEERRISFSAFRRVAVWLGKRIGWWRPPDV